MSAHENKLRAVVSTLAALVAGIVSLAGLATVASAAPPQTVTLGSTTGTPSQNICSASIDCTYVPFSGAAAPELQVPFDGTVTSFSVNAGSTGGKVQLRVLRPAGGGQFTGAGTSPAETLTATGVNTFAVSLPVRAGDVLGLDNSSSALMFDTTTPSAITAYYQPALADGSTAAPNLNRTAYRLLLSATVQQSSTTTTSTPPIITNAHESHRSWREGGHLATSSRHRRPPIGTTFSFTVSQSAQITLAFSLQGNGRRVDGTCRAQTRANRSKPSCHRSVSRGSLTFAGHAGPGRLNFEGRLSRTRRLPVGRYLVVITATNSARQTSSPVRLSFTIVK